MSVVLTVQRPQPKVVVKEKPKEKIREIDPLDFLRSTPPPAPLVLPKPLTQQRVETLKVKKTEVVQEQPTISAKQILESRLLPERLLPSSITRKEHSIGVLSETVFFLFNTNGLEIRPYATQWVSLVEHLEEEFGTRSFEERLNAGTQAISEAAHLVSSEASPMLYEQTLRAAVAKWLLIHEIRQSSPSPTHIGTIIQLATWDDRFKVNDPLFNMLPEIVEKIARQTLPDTLSFEKALPFVEKSTETALYLLQKNGAGYLLPHLEVLFKNAFAKKLTSLIAQKSDETYRSSGELSSDLSLSLLKSRLYLSKWQFADQEFRKSMRSINFPQTCISEIFMNKDFPSQVKSLKEKVIKDAHISKSVLPTSEESSTLFQKMGSLIRKNPSESPIEKIERIKNNKLNSLSWAQLQWHSDKIISYPLTHEKLLLSEKEHKERSES